MASKLSKNTKKLKTQNPTMQINFCEHFNDHHFRSMDTVKYVQFCTDGNV